MSKNNSEFEHARNKAIELLQNTDCENVVRSILFVLGDYAVTESRKEAEERAEYITSIIYYATSTVTMDALQYVHSFARGAARAKAECEKGGAKA